MSAPAAPIAERPLGAFDLELMAALHARAFPESPWSARAFGELLALPGTAGQLRLEAGVPVAFVLWRRAAEEAEILTLATDPAARRRGHAAALLAGLRAALGGAGCTQLFLEVAERNAAARALYDAGGFVQIGRRRGYYRRADGAVEDALLLQCRLAEN